MAERHKRLAVILPHVYRGGTVRLLVNILQYFQTVSDFELVLGLPSGHQRVVQEQLEVLKDHAKQVEIREFEWITLSAAYATELLEKHRIKVGRMVSVEYCSMAESNRHFLDCDFWLFISDRVALTLLPFRPYGMVVTDHLQRYVPEIFEECAYDNFNSAITNFLRNVRNADLAIATSSATYQDLRTYSGAKGRLLQIPNAIDVDYFLSLRNKQTTTSSLSFEGTYFVWVTNTAQHKNHLMSIEALRIYFERGSAELDVMVTGANTDLLDPATDEKQLGDREILYNLPYFREVRDAFRCRLSPWLDRIDFAGEVPDHEYLQILQRAKFLFHNVIADNGTFSVIEAAIMGTPSISSSYPQMHQLNDAFDLNIKFFDPFSVKSAAEALINHIELFDPNPVLINARISEHHYSNWGDELYRTIATCVSSARLEIECL